MLRQREYDDLNHVVVGVSISEHVWQTRRKIMYDFTSHHGNKEEKLPKKMSFSFKKSPKTIFGRLGARKQDKVAEPNG